MLAVTLVQSWLGLYAVKQRALDDLNNKLGTRYTHGHLSRWERGKRGPSKVAREFMLEAVLRSECGARGAKKLMERLR